MPLLCCVPNCQTNYEETNDPNNDKKLFKFPKDILLKNQWVLNIGRKNWGPCSNSAVCIKHFTSDCVIESKSCQLVNNEVVTLSTELRLRKGACPTIFPNRTITPNTTNEKNVKRANQVEVVIDLIDESSSDMVINSSTSSATPLNVSRQDTTANNVSTKSDVAQSNNNLPKIVLLHDFKKNRGKIEEESELIIDEVTANLEEDLITAVYNREPLWRSNKNSKVDDKSLESLWKEVANEVGRSVLVIKEIWASLRQRFFKEKKLVDEKKHTSWPFYNQLWFLKLNNITAEQQIAGISNNEILSPTTDNNKFTLKTPRTSNQNVTKLVTTNSSIVTNIASTTTQTNGILIPANLLSAKSPLRQSDIVFTTTTSFLPATKNLVNANSLVTIAPLVATRTTNVAATNNLVTRSVATCTSDTVTNVATTTNNNNSNTSNNTKNHNKTTDKSNEIIVLDDDDYDGPQTKKQKLQTKQSSPDSNEMSILNKLLTKQDEDYPFFRRLITRMKTLSYRDRLKFQIEVLSALDKFEKK